MAVRVTVPWRPGQVRPTKLQQVYLHRIARMIQLNDRIVLAVYNRAPHAPVAARARNDYCAFLRGVVRRIPLIRDVEIWNEANSPAYWPQDEGASAYAALLARCYDVLHRRPAAVNVISSTASRHDPAGFVFALGEAYRALGRERPLFDTFGHNPYPENSAEPPWATHFDSDLIAEGDYGTLMNVLQTAFEETGQPLPGRRGVSIWYVEDGFQTVPPPEKRRFYRGRENDGHALPAIAARTERQDGAVDQASQLRNAILLAYCQPAVSGFLNFGLLDEDRLGGVAVRVALARRHAESFVRHLQRSDRRGPQAQHRLLERQRDAARLTSSRRLPTGEAGRSVRGAFPVSPVQRDSRTALSRSKSARDSRSACLATADAARRKKRPGSPSPTKWTFVPPLDGPKEWRTSNEIGPFSVLRSNRRSGS